MIPFHNATFCLSSGTLDVFFAGCSLGCEGCHNEELWDSSGNTRSPKELMELINNPLVKTVRIMGGEPTEQPNMGHLLENIPERVELWLFTGVVPSRMFFEVFCDYLKIGEYDCHGTEWHCEELNITLASRNQYIVDCKTGKEYRYDNL